MRSIIATTPAKINLGLEILRRRSDGYHEINSVFLPVPTLCDELEISATDGEIAMTCDDPSIPTDGANLCLRAAEAMRRFGKHDGRGVHIDLRKRIPTGAGLGGGSSDAAYVLNALNTLWNVHATDVELRAVARTLGADVPFFLDPRPAVVQGIGDVITPVSFPLTLHLLLVHPGIHVNTAWAYGQVSCDPPRSRTDFAVILPSLTSIDDLAHHFRNDFEPFVFPHHPALADIERRLITAGAAYAAMSGSGSTMYGVFDSFDAVRIASSRFSDTTTSVATILPTC